MNELSESVFKNNKAVLLKALEATGIKFAYVEYSGCGDSGSGTSVTTHDGKGEVACPRQKFTFQDIASHWDVELKQWMYTVKDAEIKLNEALSRLCDLSITLANHDGYENGPGGGGTMTIDVEKGTVQLDHYDIIEEHDESSHIF